MMAASNATIATQVDVLLISFSNGLSDVALEIRRRPGSVVPLAVIGFRQLSLPLV
jgi:hypothetical protein